MTAAAIGNLIYLFGGVGINGSESILDVSDDLWVFDTAALSWNRVANSYPWPAPRRCPGWTRDGDRLLLWGGSGVTVGTNNVPTHNFLNDFWQFLPGKDTWQQIRETNSHDPAPTDQEYDAATPVPRYTPVFQSVEKGLFLYGGYTEDRLGKRKLNDVWINKNAQWNPIPLCGHQGYKEGAKWPGTRYGSMSTADLSKVYVCGGFSDEGDHNDLWQFDLASQEWRLLVPDHDASLYAPSPRYCAAFAFYQDKLFLFGGRSRRYPKLNFNDLWMFDLKQRKWSQIHDNRLPHRYDAGAEYPGYHAKSAAAIVGSEWYIWGGEGLHGHVSDFWRLKLDSLYWEQIQPARSDDPCFW